jgi:DNA-binding NarL/FixJ family response regulator
MKVLLADDHPVVLIGLRAVLEATEGFEVVGAARTGPEVLPLVGRLNPDVVLLDMHMPGIDGLGCLARLHQQYPKVKAVMISSAADPDVIQAAFKLGACGFIIKTIDAADLASAIRQAVDGTAFHAFGLPAMNEAAIAKGAGLTAKELAIAQGVARGLSNAEISKELWVTQQTVKFHLTKIFRKLDLLNRTDLARWVYANGLFGEGGAVSESGAGRLVAGGSTGQRRPS